MLPVRSRDRLNDRASWTATVVERSILSLFGHQAHFEQRYGNGTRSNWSDQTQSRVCPFGLWLQTDDIRVSTLRQWAHSARSLVLGQLAT